MAQHTEVVDAVGPGGHPRDERADLQPGIGALVCWHAQPGVGEPGQARSPSQRHHGHQARERHEIRFVKDR